MCERVCVCDVDTQRQQKLAWKRKIGTSLLSPIFNAIDQTRVRGALHLHNHKCNNWTHTHTHTHRHRESHTHTQKQNSSEEIKNNSHSFTYLLNDVRRNEPGGIRLTHTSTRNKDLKCVTFLSKKVWKVLGEREYRQGERERERESVCVCVRVWKRERKRKRERKKERERKRERERERNLFPNGRNV